MSFGGHTHPTASSLPFHFSIEAMPPISVSGTTGSRVPDRMTHLLLKPGDFFRDSLPEADLYIVCRIIHDWSDDKVHQLLSRISSSCKPGEPVSLSSFLKTQKDHFIFLKTAGTAAAPSSWGPGSCHVVPSGLTGAPANTNSPLCPMQSIP